MRVQRDPDDVLTCDEQGGADYACNGRRKTFRERFIKTGLINPIDLGTRSPLYLKSQIREAVLKIAAEQAADPSLVKPRSAGAQFAKAGRIANPWGRNGKPREVAIAAAPKKAKRS